MKLKSVSNFHNYEAVERSSQEGTLYREKKIIYAVNK